jgi:hypothetical protein
VTLACTLGQERILIIIGLLALLTLLIVVSAVSATASGERPRRNS